MLEYNDDNKLTFKKNIQYKPKQIIENGKSFSKLDLYKQIINRINISKKNNNKDNLKYIINKKINSSNDSEINKNKSSFINIQYKPKQIIENGKSSSKLDLLKQLINRSNISKKKNTSSKDSEPNKNKSKKKIPRQHITIDPRQENSSIKEWSDERRKLENRIAAADERKADARIMKKKETNLKSLRYTPGNQAFIKRFRKNSKEKFNIIDLMKKEAVFYNENQNCHRTIYPLFNLIRKHNYNIIKLEFTNQAKMWSDIWGDNSNSLIKDGDHYLITIRSPGHFWYLEIQNRKFRILSLYDGEHNFIEYSQKYEYGTFHNEDVKEVFIKLLNELNGRSIFSNNSSKRSWANIDELELSQKANYSLFGIMKTRKQIENELKSNQLKVNEGIKMIGYFHQPPTIKIIQVYQIKGPEKNDHEQVG